ncbi:unnamed protein product [Eruca vesicaria subsp. sativa]|uniref:Uncharacterized protein n=1 Tax=Eruca vesicaria subsp. sativa TaxID=29727 RepID=A0ABC8KL93_ERUVS|nr:unnamed protein product [Eruca vesicaria subsp. sativa]
MNIIWDAQQVWDHVKEVKAVPPNARLPLDKWLMASVTAALVDLESVFVLTLVRLVKPICDLY